MSAAIRSSRSFRVRLMGIWDIQTSTPILRFEKRFLLFPCRRSPTDGAVVKPLIPEIRSLNDDYWPLFLPLSSSLQRDDVLVPTF